MTLALGAPPEPVEVTEHTEDAVRIALVTPWHGPAGMFGLSCRLCSDLALAEIHDAGGLVGRPVRFHHVDGGSEPWEVAREVTRLVRGGRVDAVVGWHISAVRRALAPHVAGQVPYVYTALYEGGERTPGVLVTGETPTTQLDPAMGWMSTELGIRRWAVIGDDYVWPRSSAEAARTWARNNGVSIVHQRFVPLGTRDYGPVLDELVGTGAQGVLMLLVGEDAVHFNRAFAARGFDRDAVRLSTLMDENMLLASGAAATRNVYAAAGYFEDLATASALDFTGRYARSFGVDAPVPSSLGESCYEGLSLYASLVRRAGSLERTDLLRVADGAIYEGPRGTVGMREAHSMQDVYLARARDLQFEVVARLWSGPSGLPSTAGWSGGPVTRFTR